MSVALGAPLRESQSSANKTWTVEDARISSSYFKLVQCETPKHPPYLRSFLDLKTWTLKMFQCLSIRIECFCIKKSKISDYRHSFCNLVFSCSTSCKISPDFRNVFSQPENAVNIIKPTPFRCFVSALSRTSVAEVHPGTQAMDNSWSQLCSIVQSLPCCIGQGFSTIPMSHTCEEEGCTKGGWTCHISASVKL